MAQQDTGLGWSAKGEWLMQTSGEVARILYYEDETNFPGQPIPYLENVPSLQDIANVGMTIGRYTYDTSYEIRVVSCVENTFVCRDSVTTNYCYFLVPTTSPDWQTRRAYWVGYRPSDGSFLYSYLRYVDFTSHYITNDVRYDRMSDMNPNTDNRLPIHAINTALANIIVNAQHSVLINKVNAGYAVACLAKWKTDNNVLFTTPVLISSETENTDMSCSDTSYSLAKLNIRYDGIQFYMSFFDIVDKVVTSSVEVADLSMFNIDLDQLFHLIVQSGMANVQVTETVDPYEDFGYTEEDAGEINPDPQDDDIEVDELPTKSFASAGFCRIYNPDESDLNDLANYMWTDQNFLQTVINHLKQILENPIEAIISLSMVPVNPPVGPSKVPVNVMFISTGVSMRPVTSQFVSIDCGTTVLQEVYGGALDYNPYTRVQIYLPYIGTVQLDTDEVMAKTLHLTYHIDVVTGICCAEIEADNKLLYQFSGHCSVSQPITSADFSSYLNAAIAAAKVAVGVATGSAEVTASAAAAQAPPEVSSSTRGSQSLALVPSPSGPIGPHLGSPGGSHAWTDFSNIPEPSGGNSISWGELAKPGNVNTVASAMGGKMVVQHSGGFSGNSGYLAKRRPYLIVIRPRIANPKNYAQHFGRTSMEYLNLGSCTGYTKVQSVHLSGFDATNPELSEISSLLKGGVLM